MTSASVFGVIATILIFFSQLYEIRSIFVADPVTKQKTRPSRSTFWIWTVVQAMMVGSYIATGETFAAGVGVAYAVTILAIAILSIRYGYSQWEKLDSLCVFGMAVTVVLGLIFRSTMVILVSAILIDAIGCIPTVKKVWEDPGSESRWAWAITVVACVVNFGAVEHWGAESFLYLPYLLIVNSVIAYGIWFSPKARRR